MGNDGYAKWEVPWSLTLNYSVNYSYGAFNKQKMEYDGRITQNLSFLPEAMRSLLTRTGAPASLRA